MRRLALAIVVSAACSYAPTAPDGSEPFDPPFVYRDWFQRVEECSHRSADYSRIRWRVYTDRDYPFGQGRATFVDWRIRTIYVTRLSMSQGAPVRYAMLVYLLPGANEPPALYFEDLCGSVVQCGPTSCE